MPLLLDPADQKIANWGIRKADVSWWDGFSFCSASLLTTYYKNSKLQHPFPHMHTSCFLHATQEKGVPLHKAIKWKNGPKYASVWLHQEEAAYKGDLLQWRRFEVSALISN